MQAFQNRQLPRNVQIIHPQTQAGLDHRAVGVHKGSRTMQNRSHSPQALIHLFRRFQAKNPGFQPGFTAQLQDLFPVSAGQDRLQPLPLGLGHHQAAGITVGPVDDPRTGGHRVFRRWIRKHRQRGQRPRPGPRPGRPSRRVVGFVGTKGPTPVPPR